MQIKKEYKFYYGHRNQELNDKCFRPHGHDAKLFITFNVKREGNISTLFNDFDKFIEPMLKNEYDHRFLIDQNDKLLKYFKMYEEDEKEDLGLKILPFATSVENVTFFLFNEIVTRFNLDIQKIEYQETRSSTLIYSKEDYNNDLLIFNKSIKLSSKEVTKDTFLSPYDYFGHAIGQEEGSRLFEKAKLLNIPFQKKEISNSRYQGTVTLYPESFLQDEYSK